MIRDIVIASNNINKIDEFKRVLEPLGLRVHAQSDYCRSLKAEENGKTFLENAIIKAETLYKITKLPCIADDSGLCVNALDGAPGVYSARYSGTNSNDEMNNDKLLKDMEGKTDRTAEFICTIYCIINDHTKISVEGRCEGYIGQFPKGNNGFGYDPLFYIGNKSFSELTPEEKDKISHRGKAINKLIDILQEEIYHDEF